MKVFFPGILLLLVAFPLKAQDRPESKVGMSQRLSGVTIPGRRVEVKPIEDRKLPIVLRLLKSTPEGSGFKYDLEYFGLEPGTHDLSQYLRRADGESTSPIPPILVQVVPVLPPGQIQPNKLEIERSPWLGGYRFLLIVASVVWGLGLVLIVLSFFFPRGKAGVAVSDKPLTLADQLRPLVQGAVAGRLTHPELSQLERGLYNYWRTKLQLQHVSPEIAMQTLREHPDAGPLLRQLEDWLHHPTPSQNVDVEALLKPYQSLENRELSQELTP